MVFMMECVRQERITCVVFLLQIKLILQFYLLQQRREKRKREREREREGGSERKRERKKKSEREQRERKIGRE